MAYELNCLGTYGKCAKMIIGRPLKYLYTNCLAEKRPDTKLLSTKRLVMKCLAMKGLNPFDLLNNRYDKKTVNFTTVSKNI